MDTQTFLSDLNDHMEGLERLLGIPGDQFYMREVFDYLDRNYEVYMKATSEEREAIRAFIKEKRDDIPQGKVTFYRAYLLLMYVKERVIPKLKPARKVSILDKLKGSSESPEDIAWLLRGLVVLSMENNSESFAYSGSPYGISALVLLADLFVTAEERGLKPKKYFQQIARVSSDQGLMPMNHTMASGGDSRLIAERRHFGKFEGMF